MKLSVKPSRYEGQSGKTVNCPRCDTDVRESERLCPACSKDLGYPNVRVAKQAVEKIALGERYRNALSFAGSHSYTDVLVRFQSALRSSQAVLCRSISKVKELMSNDNELYASFYKLVGAGARRPEKSVIERERLLADQLLFPYYGPEIRFAALSLDGTGVTEYGSCSMVLKDATISDRATVFEENSLEFCHARKLGFGNPVPPGYRADWDDRERLGCAKLYARLGPSTDDRSFPKILSSGRDFVEVHIHGSLHRRSLERIVIGRRLSPPDKVLLSAIKGILKKDKLVIPVEEKS
jgi:hypothetical protein